MPDPVLSPFVAGVRVDTERALISMLREWLEEPHATITPSRNGNPLSLEPTRLELSSPEGSLCLLVRNGSDSAWRAGPVAITVERPADLRATTDAGPRRWLRHLSHWFTNTREELRASQGNLLARALQRWATARVLDDRYYRHFERATDGLHAFLRPSFRCNQDCHFCWEGRDWPDPPREQVLEWLDAMHGADRLTLCGGEPTAARGFLELVERATEVHGMRVHVNTNAIRFANAGFAERARSAGVVSALVSLHSADPAISDAMTRAPGTHGRTVAGIHAALEAGIRVVVNCVVEAANVDGLADHARFVCDTFVERHPNNPLWAVEYSQPGPYYDRVRYGSDLVPIDLARTRISEAAAVLRERGVLMELTHTCGFPACIASEATDLAAWRPHDDLDADELRSRSLDLAPCRRCAAADRCPGVRREYVAKWGDRGLTAFASPPWAAQRSDT